MQPSNLKGALYWHSDPSRNGMRPYQQRSPLVGALRPFSSGNSPVVLATARNEIQRLMLLQRLRANLPPVYVTTTMYPQCRLFSGTSHANFDLGVHYPCLGQPDSLLTTKLLAFAECSTFNPRPAAARRQPLLSSDAIKRIWTLSLARSSLIPTMSGDCLNGPLHDIEAHASHLFNSNELQCIENPVSVRTLSSGDQTRTVIRLAQSSPTLTSSGQVTTTDTSSTAKKAFLNIEALDVTTPTNDLSRTSVCAQGNPINKKENSSSNTSAVEALWKEYRQDTQHERTAKRVAALQALGLSCLKRRIDKSPYIDASMFQDPHPLMFARYHKPHGSISESFPEKLYRMIEEVEMNGNQNIISFFPHGRAFGIHKPEKFATEIMPKYFKHARLTSFQRQLGLYGFGRMSSGPDAGGYYHELFLRNRPVLLAYIARVGSPNTELGPRKRGVKLRSSVIDPDLYAMPEIRHGRVK